MADAIGKICAGMDLSGGAQPKILSGGSAENARVSFWPLHTKSLENTTA